MKDKLAEAMLRIDNLHDAVDQVKLDRDDLLDSNIALRTENAALKAELETERLRLAACGVAALGYFEGCKDEYRSASLDDTLRLYEQNKTLKAALTICADQFDAYAEHHKRKMEDADDDHGQWESSKEKYHRNQLLAFNARKVLK